MGVSQLFSPKILTKFLKEIYTYENHNISKADVLLFSCDPLSWLEAFKRSGHISGPKEKKETP